MNNLSTIYQVHYLLKLFMKVFNELFNIVLNDTLDKYTKPLPYKTPPSQDPLVDFLSTDTLLNNSTKSPLYPT